MRRNDPKRVAARGERDQAAVWLEILCKGIGHALADGCQDTDSIRAIIGSVNNELTESLKASEAANKAYEPYWRPLRRVTVIARKKKKVA